ncbi:MAG: RsmE family RNA methyltransferase [Treponemataceae bacterium]|nr:RsmE family RNA methyltransferase [Treponemataceae bacterium]MDE7392310.1 RsmE family RNA methyltransferase [Treponemataceae bacterium]
MNICLFAPEEIARPLCRNDERAEHIVKVLHKRAGDSFDAGIIGGQSGIATIMNIVPPGEPDAGAVHFSFVPTGSGKPLFPLTMIVGFPRPIQLRRLLRDVAGLGVQCVHLTGTELGDKSYQKSSVVENGAAYKMLLDGTAQAASTHVPALHVHATLAECIAAVQAAHPAAPESAPAKIALDNVRPATSLRAFLAGNASRLHSTVAAIGSERGWTDRERAFLEQHGFVRCGMGDRILRTETAATVAGALILDAMGKLG